MHCVLCAVYVYKAVLEIGIFAFKCVKNTLSYSCTWVIPVHHFAIFKIRLVMACKRKKLNVISVVEAHVNVPCIEMINCLDSIYIK
jgi:hypothetical protein